MRVGKGAQMRMMTTIDHFNFCLPLARKKAVGPDCRFGYFKITKIVHLPVTIVEERAQEGHKADVFCAANLINTGRSLKGSFLGASAESHGKIWGVSRMGQHQSP